MNFNELSNEQARRSVDCKQAFAVWRDADLLRSRRRDLRFDDDALKALPQAVQALIDGAAARLLAGGDDGSCPNW
jgi:hypothetical protein